MVEYHCYVQSLLVSEVDHVILRCPPRPGYGRPIEGPTRCIVCGQLLGELDRYDIWTEFGAEVRVRAHNRCLRGLSGGVACLQ